MSVTLRLLEPEDASVLAALYRANRDFLAPWEPVRTDRFFTDEVQQDLVASSLAEHAAGRAVPFMILDDGLPVGRINVSDVVRGPFQSAHLGYWVAHDHNGRGVASAAVAEVAKIAFGELGLHRLQAATLIHNEASQRVLTRNGFERIGFAPSYLQIAGRWQDHFLFQRISDAAA